MTGAEALVYHMFLRVIDVVITAGAITISLTAIVIIFGMIKERDRKKQIVDNSFYAPSDSAMFHSFMTDGGYTAREWFYEPDERL